MDNEIEQPNPEDVLTAIQSFNDPSIIVNIFRELGWSYSIEIQETLTLAKQNANLSIKFKAIKHLRELLREAAEASGYVANVSQTIPNAQGGVTTFHAKRIAGALNPVKKIESTIKEPENDKTKETKAEPDRDGDRGQGKTKGDSADSSITGTDTRRAFPPGDADSGGVEQADGGETSERPGISDGRQSGTSTANDSDSEKSNPCVKTRKPTCNRDLFKGIATSAED